MSNRWPAGIIRKTPVTPAGPLQNGVASGVWSLADAAYWTKQGLWPTAGNFLAVEDVFSTYLYTGNGSTQTITNGIDLAGKGGLIWLKNRSSTAGNVIASHALYDTVRGIGAIDYVLRTDTTAAQNGIAAISSVNSDGFTFGGGNQASGGNNSGDTYASWTFREAPNFFDVVTWTGNGANRNIAHNLGVAPGMIIVKRTDAAANWQVYHRGLSSAANSIQLNLTSAQAAASTVWNSTAPTATEFTVGTDATVNASGGTYVAYLYAHDATSDGIIQCGAAAAGTDINLGWEPQFVVIKRYDGDQAWFMNDNMRGMSVGGNTAADLSPNTSGAESTGSNNIFISSTGFKINLFGNYIYIAIRRGPMRTPTLGTSVFAPVARTGTGTTFVETTNFPVDSVWLAARSQARGSLIIDRLRGFGQILTPNTTDAEFTNATFITSMGNTGFVSGSETYLNTSGQTYVDWNFRRAPSFFDEVCYTGSGSGTQTPKHNLTVTPEMFIVKARGSAGYDWMVWHKDFGLTGWLTLNQNSAKGSFSTAWPSLPTATVFPTSSPLSTDNGGTTYVAYLFASAPGVSKVGSYTGNGSSQTINCAFTTGARFVMIKRTDSTGDWYVWDSARGIVAGNDPYLALNSTAAEVTTNDSVDTDNTGFIVNQVAASNVNASGGTYIFLAIA